jgi:hypothetical protein
MALKDFSVRKEIPAILDWSDALVSLRMLVLPVSAAGLWATSLVGVEPGQMNDLGLVSVLPVSFYAALLLLTIGFCLSLRERSAPGWLLPLHVALLILIIHATPTLLYGTLRYAWAWKHISIVGYIQRHGSVNPEISDLGVYHNWPGFFIIGALLTEVSGLNSALVFAPWGAPFFNLLFLLGLMLVVGTWTRDTRLMWLSAWFFFLTNWVAQDYFSPQALTYFLYLVILGICLRWFASATLPGEAWMKSWLGLRRVDGLARALGVYGNISDEPRARARAWQRVGLIALLMLLCVTVASSHQLTPFMTILALAALVAFGRCSARGLPTLMAVMTATWIMYMAVAFLNGNLRWIIESIGLLTNNIDSNLIDLAVASPGQRFVAQVDRGLSALIGLLACAGSIRRLREGHRDLPAWLLAVAPLPMVAANSYGGEILFRAYFFALPALAFLAAALLYPKPLAGTSWRTTTLAMVVSVTLLAGLLVAYYGKERMNYFSPGEVSASEYLYRTAPAGALLVDGTWNYPHPLQNYERYTYRSLLTLSERQKSRLSQDPVGVVAELMYDRRYPAAYLIITRGQKAAIEMTGSRPAGFLDNLEQTLTRSGRYQVAFVAKDATIFTRIAPPA